MLRSVMPQRLAFASLLAFVIAAALLVVAGERAGAVEPGVNCATYDGETCVVAIGDIYFCEALYTKDVCPTSISAGDTVRWDYPSEGIFFHTTTECGQDCDAPTETPLWDSDRLMPGESFERTFTEPGNYFYYCTVHPSQRGMIRVLEGAGAPTPTATPASALVGDVNCSGAVDSIDAALVLQVTAGLVDSLACGENADANDDGTTNAIDAALILQLTAGLLPNLPV